MPKFKGQIYGEEIRLRSSSQRGKRKTWGLASYMPKGENALRSQSQMGHKLLVTTNSTNVYVYKQTSLPPMHLIPRYSWHSAFSERSSHSKNGNWSSELSKFRNWCEGVLVRIGTPSILILGLSDLTSHSPGTSLSTSALPPLSPTDLLLRNSFSN